MLSVHIVVLLCVFWILKCDCDNLIRVIDTAFKYDLNLYRVEKEYAALRTKELEEQVELRVGCSALLRMRYSRK
jgi:hypothetical protein